MSGSDDEDKQTKPAAAFLLMAVLIMHRVSENRLRCRYQSKSLVALSSLLMTSFIFIVTQERKLTEQ